MTADEPVRVLMVGAGGFGGCWWPALSGDPRFRVVGVVEPDEQHRAAAGAHFGLSPGRLLRPGEGCWDALGATLMIDSSPFPHHLSNLRRAAAAGLDAIFAKPMASSIDEATTMVRLMTRSQLELAVAQQMRYFPCFLALRRALADRVAGAPVAVRVRMALDGRGWEPGTEWRLAMRHPLLLEASIHHFDLLRWVFGTEFGHVAAHTWNPVWSPFAGDATAVVQLRGEAGVRVDYAATFAPAPDEAPVRFDSGWDVFCESGVLRVRDGDLLLDDRVLHAADRPDPVSLEELNSALLEDWHAARAEGRPVAFDGADNLASLRLVAQAIEAAEAGVAEMPEREAV